MSYIGDTKMMKRFIFMRLRQLCLKRMIKKFPILLFLFIYLFLEMGEGREKEREININVWLLLTWLPLGTWPETQACALTGNWTGNPLVRSPHSIHWATPASTETSILLNKIGYNCLTKYIGYLTTIKNNSIYIYYLRVLKKSNETTVEPKHRTCLICGYCASELVNCQQDRCP